MYDKDEISLCFCEKLTRVTRKITQTKTCKTKDCLKLVTNSYPHYFVCFLQPFPDQFDSGLSSSSEWFSNLFEDPLLSDRIPPGSLSPNPHIQSEHSYSMMNEPCSPLMKNIKLEGKKQPILLCTAFDLKWTCKRWSEIVVQYFGSSSQWTTQQKLLFHQSLHCTVTTWWPPQWWCSHCYLILDAVTTGQWLHRTHPALGITTLEPIRNLARHLLGNYTVTTMYMGRD